ncbi:CobQ/CobB/MinD/ParA nucleotide binding domain protein [Snodgrassella alvi SCGC AB-598-O02]|nr:CobQ/CobB/MinD/ParA nucleotide binding domain protein [Snodgrassella alvi SCGC AB-598-O02]
MKTHTSFPFARIITLFVLWLTVTYLFAGGIWLSWLGGSPFYIVMALLLGLFTCLYQYQRSSCLWLYAFILFTTLIWSLSESGTDFWSLAPRVDILFLFGLWFLTPWSTRQFTASGSGKTVITIALIAILTVMFYSISHDPQQIK